MKTMILAAALVTGSTVQAYAQQKVTPAPTGGPESIIRTPSSSNGSSNGTSGNVGVPRSMYPPRVQDYSDPAASYGRLGTPYLGNGVSNNRR